MGIKLTDLLQAPSEWEATPELRWFDRRDPRDPQHIRTRSLQQKWIKMATLPVRSFDELRTGQSEWRDVPELAQGQGGAAVMTPILRKGDHITCTNGHVIGEVLEDIGLGTMNWGAMIGKWRQEDHPIPGSMKTSKCAICGAEFMREAGGLHISGWR